MATGLLQRNALERSDEVSPRRPDLNGEVGDFWEDQFGLAGEEADPMLELARWHPEVAVSFLRAALLLGLVTGALLPIPCAAFLAAERETWSQCNRPLHLWALVHCGLNLLQAPVRLCIYLKLGRMPDADGVQQVITSGAWKGCQSLSMAGYAWFVIGVVWLVNSDFHGPCGGLARLAFGLVVVALMKPILTMAAFRHYVPANLQNADRLVAGAPRGATEEVINSLAITQFAEDGRETSCAVCLVDFEEGESLRQLPCRHKFHAPCVDKWLAKNSRCPLCMHEVDVPFPSHACARC